MFTFSCGCCVQALILKSRIPDLQQYCKWTTDSPVILGYPLQLLFVVCKSDWLLYKKRCASVCAWKDKVLVKCREGVKRYTSIALIQGWRPLGWKPILVMSAFCGTKLLQFPQNLEAQMSVYVCVCVFFSIVTWCIIFLFKCKLLVLLKYWSILWLWGLVGRNARALSGQWILRMMENK